MAEYKSRFANLSFYVEGVRKKFQNGRYVTDNKDEIAVLDQMTDAQRVDVETPKQTNETKQAEDDGKKDEKQAEEKPQSKSSSRGKGNSGKSSAR